VTFIPWYVIQIHPSSLHFLFWLLWLWRKYCELLECNNSHNSKQSFAMWFYLALLKQQYLWRFEKYPVTDQRHYSVKMKQRQLIELQSWFLASIVLSASVFVPAYASPRPPQARNALGPDGVQDLIAGPGCLDCAVTGLESYRQQGRQDDGLGGIGSIISLGIKLAPTLIQLFNTLTSGSGSSSDSSTSSSSSSSSNTVDRVETTPAADPFSWSNLISMGIKVGLALLSSYTSDGIDKSDAISPSQAVLGTIISALTGSEDPKEVATFAKQADEVFTLVQDLGNAVFTSLTSWMIPSQRGKERSETTNKYDAMHRNH